MLALPSMSVQHHSGTQKTLVTWCNNDHLKFNVNRIKALEINKIENIDCSHNPGSVDL